MIIGTCGRRMRVGGGLGVGLGVGGGVGSGRGERGGW